VDHARANAAAVRRQSAANRQRRASEAAAAAAGARASSALDGVRSSGYASPAYCPRCGSASRCCCVNSAATLCGSQDPACGVRAYTLKCLLWKRVSRDKASALGHRPTPAHAARCCPRRRPGSALGDAAAEAAGDAGCRQDDNSSSTCDPGDGGAIAWTKKPEYGRVPAYLLDIKLQLAQQRAAEQARAGQRGRDRAWSVVQPGKQQA